MAQRLKPEVHDRLLAAAAREFAERSVLATTMADIAKTAKVPIGNVYRYVTSKDALLDEVIPTHFVTKLRRLLRVQIEALADEQTIPTSERHPYRVASAETLAFCFANRDRVLILLRGAVGTPHAGFATDLANRLTTFAIAYAARAYDGLRLVASERSVVNEIYHNLISALGAALAKDHDEPTLRAAVALQTEYHLAGMKALFEHLATRRAPRA